MIAAHQTMLAPQGAPLPYDAEVEYLQSTGSQYVDTGIGATASTQVDVSFSLAQSFQYGNTMFIFGAYSDSDRCYYSVAIPSGTELRIPKAEGPNPNSFVNISAATGIGNVKTLSYKPGAIYLDNVLVSNDTALTDSPVDIFVFARNTNGSVDNLTGGIRIYWLKIYDGTTLVRDFVPVRKGTTGYLYDKVTKTLFGNAGTGSFVLGPDK